MEVLEEQECSSSKNDGFVLCKPFFFFFLQMLLEHSFGKRGIL